MNSIQFIVMMAMVSVPVAAIGAMFCSKKHGIKAGVIVFVGVISSLSLTIAYFWLLFFVLDKLKS